MSSFPLFGAPAVSPVSPVAQAQAPATGRSSPVVVQNTVPVPVPASSTISGSNGGEVDFTGVTGYTVPFSKYDKIFPSVSKSAFSQREPKTRASSPVSFPRDADAAAAALRTTPP